MAKPRLIILIRHAQSEGNKNREIHQSTPDHRVKLTQEGWSQAHEAGHRLRKLLRPDDTLHFFTSPYRRTRETTEGILATLTSDNPEPSPYRRSNIKVYEEPRLREQDFGNFQPCSAEMERMWQERADYGHFFYRIPNGESAADAYDRVSGFNESLWRQFGEDDFASVCVLVTHGLMSRVFLMKWYHFSVEYFEDLRNVNHCEFLIMRKQDSSKYHLETKLRTWSELHRERTQAIKDKERDKDKDKDKDGEKDAKNKTSKNDSDLDRTKSFVVKRRWGGCPDGCNHTKHYKKRHDAEASGQGDTDKNPAGVAVKRQQRYKMNSSDDDGDGDDEHEHGHGHEQHASGHDNSTKQVSVAVTHVTEDSSSPDDTTSFIMEDRVRVLKAPHLHIGRDGGGTYSGHASIAGSDTDGSEDEVRRRQHIASLNSGIQSGSATALANRLGDEPGVDGTVMVGQDEEEGEEDLDEEEEDLEQVEKEDRSIMGSVY